MNSNYNELMDKLKDIKKILKEKDDYYSPIIVIQDNEVVIKMHEPLNSDKIRLADEYMGLKSHVYSPCKGYIELYYIC